MSPTDSAKSRKRALGSYYTPAWMARWMVDQALRPSFSPNTVPRVVDPACGDGAFLLPVLAWLSARCGVPQDDIGCRISLVKNHVFGVDADAPAVDQLRRRVREWIGPVSPLESEIADVLQSNFRWGDALTGRDWQQDCTQSETELACNDSPSSRIDHPNAAVADPSQAPSLDWQSAFPAVAQAGGFDLVIGNPPYRRELRAKSDFDRIAASLIGKRWRTARMDLCHYFFHRGLDLLRPAGRLSFIVSSYWTESTSAKVIRQRLQDETDIELIVSFGAAPLFHNVTGRHMMLTVRQGKNHATPCRVLDLSMLNLKQIERALGLTDHLSHAPPSPDRRSPLETADRSLENLDHDTVRWQQMVTQKDLWSHGALKIHNVVQSVFPPSKRTIGDCFVIRQGIAENPPFVTRAMAQELGKPWLIGKGVFVLSVEEVTGLPLNQKEMSLLRPYFPLSAIGRFHVLSESPYRILYLTRQTAPDLDELPNISSHLQKYRAFLERRREVQSGQISWWHLHWPRDERLFLSPRILCHQMVSQPRFACCEFPAFVGFSANVIVQSHSLGSVTESVDSPTSTPLISLTALSGILNSTLARRWFEAHAKRRGKHLDISGAVLKKFPLPDQTDSPLITALEELVRRWPGQLSDTSVEDHKLDQLVAGIYGVHATV